MSELSRLIEVVARLRDKKTGCPWDSVQTNMSIRRYLVEETGEYLDALESGDDHAVMDELGDLLLQVVLNAQIAKDEGRFDIEDVAKSEADKMIRRHPHVFGTSDVHTEDALLEQWERIKHTEQGYTERKSAMDGIPRSVPGLQRAQKAMSKSTKAGFKWSDADGIFNKIDEELSEVKKAVSSGSKEEIAEEIGDLLLAITALCQQQDIQAEESMHAAILKYITRFSKMEHILHDSGKDNFADCPAEQLKTLWNQAKADSDGK